VDGALPLEVEASVEHNAEVHQATGFVSARAATGVTEALLLLRAYAFASERPLLDVARDVLAGRLQIPLEGIDE
jgi:AmiR/NasT family two-component response regulator